MTRTLSITMDEEGKFKCEGDPFSHVEMLGIAEFLRIWAEMRAANLISLQVAQPHAEQPAPRDVSESEASE